MKFTKLRHYIQNKKFLSSLHVLKDCELVIDGDSYFRDTYKRSGCQFLLGSDCNEYADHITTNLSALLSNNVTCYVVFKGAIKHDVNNIKTEFHEKIVNDVNNHFQIHRANYFHPLFFNDVQKQVLEKLNIKYFVSEYDSMEAIVGVAKKFNCPILTSKLEYCLFGVSCILPNSLDLTSNCLIYEHDKVKTAVGVFGKTAVLLALLNESGDYLNNLAEVISDGDCDIVWPVIRWVKRQREANLLGTVLNYIEDEDERKTFKEIHEKIQTLYLYPTCNLAVKYFRRERAHGLFKDDKKWFEKGVANGRIAVPYINLKKRGLICGSLIINDYQRPDALLAALDIIVYSHCLLKNSQDSTITFLGRSCKISSVKEIETYWDKPVSNRDIFTKHRVGKKLKLLVKEPEAFELFLQEVLPGYNYKQPLETVPDECWILIITLVYYVYKKNNDFIYGAYCVLLSYFMLGPMSKAVDVSRKNQNNPLSSDTRDSVTFYNGLKFLFDEVDLKQKYDRKIVHDFSEFQHCLQHMNYLNKMCGENIPCTIYQDTYNATFIYNTYLYMENREQFMEYLGHRFAESSALNKFKNIVSGFKNCLSVAKIFGKK